MGTERGGEGRKRERGREREGETNFITEAQKLMKKLPDGARQWN